MNPVKANIDKRYWDNLYLRNFNINKISIIRESRHSFITRSLTLNLSDQGLNSVYHSLNRSKISSLDNRNHCILLFSLEIFYILDEVMSSKRLKKLVRIHLGMLTYLAEAKISVAACAGLSLQIQHFFEVFGDAGDVSCIRVALVLYNSDVVHFFVQSIDYSFVIGVLTLRLDMLEISQKYLQDLVGGSPWDSNCRFE